MKVKDFIALYEDIKPHCEKLPEIKAKKIKSFLTSFNKAFNAHRDVEGRGEFMKFLSDLEQLYDALDFVEKKDETLVNKEDIADCRKYTKMIKDYIKKNDEVIDTIKAGKTMKGLKEYIKNFYKEKK